MSLETYKTLVVSTGHLTSPTEIPDADIVQYKVGEYGWMILVAEGAQLNDPATLLNEHAAALIALARNEGCDWIRFDCDGPVVEGVGTFDW